MKVLARLAFFWALLIFARLITLQIFRHDELLRQAQQQQDREVELAAPRGVIFDRTGQRLAMSLPVDSVCVNPLRVPDVSVASDLLSRVLGLNQGELLDKLKSAVDNHRGFMWVKRKITPEESEKLRSYSLDWIEFRTESRRFYPKGALGSHVLGSVDHIEKGNAGIELTIDPELEGKPGLMKTTSDVRQRVVDMQVNREPQPGKNITLSIDERIQYVAEQELAAAVVKNHCKTGSVVAMNPNTGEIYAMAAYPSFDSNVPPAPGAPLDNRTNLAVSSPFEPGSVFKVITLSAALETTKLRPNTVIPCGNGKIVLFKRVVHDHGSYAALSMTDVLAKSSNTGAIWIGLHVGNQNMYDYVKRFGFGKATGIPLPGESGGLVRNLKKWIPSSIGSVAMGHEIMTTTLQLARACSVIANGGLLIQPRLTMKRESPGKQQPEEEGPAPVRVIKPETAFTMAQMMRHVLMPGGTGTTAALRGYSVAGKTGSAQMFDYKTRTYTHKYNASFMGFAPVSKPALVVVVTLNGSSLYGGVVAAPVFHNIATAALRILGVPKDQAEDDLPPAAGKPVDDSSLAELSEPLSEEEQVAAGLITPAPAVPVPGIIQGPWSEEQTRFLQTHVPPSLTMVTGPKAPDFRGKTMRQVIQDSAESGVGVEFVGSGVARVQYPPPGIPLHPGEKVRVEFLR